MCSAETLDALGRILNGKRHAQASSALRLLGEMVRIESTRARKIWTGLGLSAPSVVRLLGKQGGKKATDKAATAAHTETRVPMLTFLLRCLSPVAPAPFKVELLALDDVAYALFAGLVDDAPGVAIGALEGIWAAVLADGRLGLDIKLRVVQAGWSSLVRAQHRVEESEADVDEVHTVGHSAHRFILAAVTLVADLVASESGGRKTPFALYRRTLGDLLGCLKVGEHARDADVAQLVLRRCPDVTKGCVKLT